MRLLHALITVVLLLSAVTASAQAAATQAPPTAPAPTPPPTPAQLIAQLMAFAAASQATVQNPVIWMADITIDQANYRGTGPARKVVSPNLIGTTSGTKLSLYDGAVGGNVYGSTEVKTMSIELGVSTNPITTLGKITVVETPASGKVPAVVRSYILPANMTLTVLDATAGRYILNGRTADGKAVIALHLRKHTTTP